MHRYFFELKNSQRSFVMGLASRYTEFPLGRSFNYVGIRFLPSAFSRLFRMTALELTNRCEALDSVDSGAAAFISLSFHPALTFQEQKSILDGYFLNHIRHAPVKRDPRVCRALHTILANGGDLQLARDLDPGLSPRQLRRLFNQDVGGSPKTFSRIIRFQHVLRTAKTYHNVRRSHFFDAGYYDQSHFIKEFEALYGQLPSKALKR
ncbi:helix-turn-helix domain-containing protein [Aliifodinibius salicampi]|uniref:Helix-turn-helix domain-containing protein n=1 Tax=Fodinibius salicampi TaxID=1920655 RepID=A0ABT3PXE3_9BACT|nr:helix-turn-helix domain-containing protein [Fodinibius salicampi]MCW9712534.1 helix-turn-helix domain-containing protein [Fodinibius salicampi]